MLIWISVVLPLVIAGAVYLIFNHKIIWWELGIQIVVPFILTLGAKSCAEHSQTRATEYWGSYAASAAYFEPWNEKVSCRHDIPCSHPEYSKDSEGRRYQSGYKHFNDGYRHAFDVDEHGPDWVLYSASGGSLSIEQGTFERLCHQFGNRTFVELNRRFYTKDGDKYVTTWDSAQWDKIEPMSEARTYENRVQATKNVFNFPEVNPQDFGLYAYPSVNGYTQRCVLGNAGTNTVRGMQKIDYLNATLGRAHQVRLFVLIFKDQPIQAGIDQESYWKGGNKNEFVTCIGVDSAYDVKWCHVFSWTEVDTLKIQARGVVLAQKTLDLAAYADWLAKEIPAQWRRKSFSDFSYLTVDPPTSVVVWTFVLTLLVSVGMSVFAVLNDVDSGHARVSLWPKGWSFHIKKKEKGDL